MAATESNREETTQGSADMVSSVNNISEIKEEVMIKNEDSFDSSNQPKESGYESPDENSFLSHLIKVESCTDDPVEPEFFSFPSSWEVNQSEPSTSSCYKCGSCNFSTDKEIVFEIHLKDCALDESLRSMMASILIGIKQRCYFCQFESDNLDILMAHHAEHAQLGQIATFQCDKCAHSTENRYQLVCHTLSHNKYKCRQCPYFHTFEKCVIKHSKNHSFSVKLIAACTSCSFKAVDPGDWEGHLTAHRLSGQAVEIGCAGCAYRSNAPFNQRSVEVHHKKTKHRGFLAQISLFRCGQCPYVSYFKWDFIQHTKTYHPDSTPSNLKVLSCGKCAYVASTKLELKQHFDKHHARIVYKCDDCQFQTRRNERYQLHIINAALTQHHDRQHHKITELAQYKCKICDFTSTSDHDLNTHKLLHKTQELMVTMMSNASEADCSKTNIPESILPQENSKSLNKNETNPKIAENRNRTDEVKKTFKHIKTDMKRNRGEVTDLMSSSPKKPKASPYKCFYCEFKADQKIEVDRHEKTTHRTFDGLFTCPFCAYETTKRCDLRRHYTRKHKSSFKCVNCLYETGSKSCYIQHCASHKRDVNKLHQCSVCDYTNDRKSMVQRHELTHKDMSLFCDLCNYKTRRKDDLTRHKSKRHEVHTDNYLKLIKDQKV